MAFSVFADPDSNQQTPRKMSSSGPLPRGRTPFGSRTNHAQAPSEETTKLKRNHIQATTPVDHTIKREQNRGLTLGKVNDAENSNATSRTTRKTMNDFRRSLLRSSPPLGLTTPAAGKNRAEAMSPKALLVLEMESLPDDSSLLVSPGEIVQQGPRRATTKLHQGVGGPSLSQKSQRIVATKHVPSTADNSSITGPACSNAAGENLPTSTKASSVSPKKDVQLKKTIFLPNAVSQKATPTTGHSIAVKMTSPIVYAKTSHLSKRVPLNRTTPSVDEPLGSTVRKPKTVHLHLENEPKQLSRYPPKAGNLSKQVESDKRSKRLTRVASSSEKNALESNVSRLSVSTESSPESEGFHRPPPTQTSQASAWRLANSNNISDSPLPSTPGESRNLSNAFRNAECTTNVKLALPTSTGNRSA